MLVRFGSWFEFEAASGGLYLKAPLLGAIWIGRDGEKRWDR